MAISKFNSVPEYWKTVPLFNLDESNCQKLDEIALRFRKDQELGDLWEDKGAEIPWKSRLYAKFLGDGCFDLKYPFPAFLVRFEIHPTLIVSVQSDFLVHFFFEDKICDDQSFIFGYEEAVAYYCNPDQSDYEVERGIKAYTPVFDASRGNTMTKTKGQWQQSLVDRIVRANFWLLTLLFLLAKERKTVTTYNVKTKGQGKFDSLSRKERTNVIINLGEVHKQIERNKQNGIYSPRSGLRLHQVRGHWAHWHRTDNCDHDWQERKEGSFKCSKCGEIKTWRKDHKRGDESLGVVHKTYEVKL